MSECLHFPHTSRSLHDDGWMMLQLVGVLLKCFVPLSVGHHMQTPIL